MIELGPIAVIAAEEEAPEGAYVRLLPFSWDAHFYPWWSEATRACLEAMGEQDLRGLHVVDFGCGGSAILAMAAARLGAARVTAIERQASLVEEARRQIAANGLAIELVQGEKPVECDYLVANVGDALLAGQVSRYAPHGVATDNEGRLLRW